MTHSQGNCKGGAVLTVLHDAGLAATGEPDTHQLCRHLIEQVGQVVLSVNLR